MNFRNRDLKDVFEERYQANHNKELEETTKNNKKNLMNRMLGNNQTNSSQTISNRQNKPIGYNPNSKRW